MGHWTPTGIEPTDYDDYDSTTYYLWNKSPKQPWLSQNEVQNEKPKNWRLLLTSKSKNCHHLDLVRIP